MKVQAIRPIIHTDGFVRAEIQHYSLVFGATAWDVELYASPEALMPSVTLACSSEGEARRWVHVINRIVYAADEEQEVAA